MKSLEINSTNTKHLHIEPIKNGIIGNSYPQKEQSLGFRECKNTEYKNGRLITRPALNTNTDSILDNRDFLGGDHSFEMTDMEFSYEGDIKRMALEKIFDYMATFICLTHILNSDGTYFKNIPIYFNRIDDDTFYIPNKINFFKGKPQNGLGIFCITETLNIEDYSQHSSKIFELNADMTQWMHIFSAYTPTALINGRGNKYEIAKGTGQAFSGTPTRLEGLNILNGNFHAYYSTDGLSSSFRLPFAGLSSQRIVGRLYYSVQNYVEWNIQENASTAVANLYNVDVTMHVNREKGIVYFTVPAGEYEMPLISDRNENNLRITAVKNCEYSLTDIAAADSVINEEGKIIIAAKNNIFIADSENPLYFPLQSAVKLGESDKNITALAKAYKTIFAFKENEVYTLSLKKGEILNTTSLLADSDAVFYSGDSISFDCINRNLGCKSKNTITGNNNLIWLLGNDEKIHSLSNTGKVDCALNDSEITSFLSADSTISTDTENGCIFINDSHGIAVKNENSLYYWEFPEEIQIKGAYTINGNTFLLCKTKYKNLAYICKLEGVTDTWLDGSVLSPTVKEKAVSSYFLTDDLTLDCDNTLKNINSLSLKLKGKNAIICLNNRLKFRAFNLKEKEFTTVKIAPYLCGTDRINITVSSENPIEVGCIDIKYTSLEF